MTVSADVMTLLQVLHGDDEDRKPVAVSALLNHAKTLRLMKVRARLLVLTRTVAVNE
jgi:hypothetical protein